jgi:hypothetical protein
MAAIMQPIKIPAAYAKINVPISLCINVNLLSLKKIFESFFSLARAGGRDMFFRNDYPLRPGMIFFDYYFKIFFFQGRISSSYCFFDRPNSVSPLAKTSLGSRRKDRTTMGFSPPEGRKLRIRATAYPGTSIVLALAGPIALRILDSSVILLLFLVGSWNEFKYIVALRAANESVLPIQVPKLLGSPHCEPFCKR